MLVLVVGALLAVLSFSLQYCKCETQCIISVTFPLNLQLFMHTQGFSRDCCVCVFSLSGGNITSAELYLHSHYVPECGVCVQWEYCLN